MKFRLLSFVRVCVVLALLLTLSLTQARTGAAAPAAANPSGLIFIENAGQFSDGAHFQVRGRDHTLWLAEDAIWLTLFGQGGSTTAGSPPSRADGVNIKLSFPGANPHPRLEPFNRLETHVSFFTGSDPAKWQAGVPAWGGVRYVDLYPGIDLELTGEQGELVPRLAARPGADLSAVRLRVEGAQEVTLAGDALRLSTSAGEASWPLLRAKGSSAEAASSLVAQGAFEVTAPFVAEPRASASALAPDDDPTQLLYSTFLGGSGEDAGYGIAVDGSGAAYLTGETWSSDFPTTPGTFDASYEAGYASAFVAKVNACGSSLEYATFLGGNYGARGYDIAVDGSGAAYVTGDTWSIDFPRTPGAFDTTYNGAEDAFVVKLNAAGSALVYATFLGGSSDEPGRGIAVDGSGAAYVTGYTSSSDFPTTPGALETSFQGGPQDAFVAKLNPAGSALDYSTFLGGTGDEDFPAIAIDGSGAAYVAGYTLSPDFPATPGALDTTLEASDAFVAKVNAAGSSLDYATFLGGTDDDGAHGIAVDGSGAAYVIGDTWSSDFPITPNAFDTSIGDCELCRDAFVAKLNAAGSALDYATFLGGNARERGVAIAVDGGGSAFVTGSTWSVDFPVTPDAFDTSYNNVGNNDAFVAKLNVTGSGLDYATFFGGLDYESGESIAVDGSGAVYVTGQTGASDFPTTPGAFDTSYNGAGDGFVARLAIGGRAGYCITGRVTNSSGEAVPLVTVSAGVGGSGLTDTSGNYAISDVVTGTYTLTPSLGGRTFDPVTRSVSVPPDAMGQDFTLVRHWLYLPMVFRN